MAAVVAVALIAAGYFVPPQIWTRDSAHATLKAAYPSVDSGTGNSRVPCRGPNKNLYVFGYTLSLTRHGWPINASGSVCWDIFKSEWAWRVDPPYDHMSSDRSVESRGR